MTAHSETSRVLITGALGNLGRKIALHLDAAGRCDLRLLDVRSDPSMGVEEADLAVYDPAWVELMCSQDTIVHLAADSRAGGRGNWPSLQRNNVDALLNILEAASAGKVGRVILASSMRVFEGYGHIPVGADEDLMPRPVGHYAVTKVLAERLSAVYASRRGLSVLCLRIGMALPGANRPEDLPDNAVKRQRWLGNEDFCQAVEKAIHCEHSGFALLNIVSDNEGMPWDLSRSREMLGYRPSNRAPEPAKRVPRSVAALRRGGQRLSRKLSRVFVR